jgi:hypothetical protein
MLTALIAYFVGGLWLAGQDQLAVLRSRWLVQDTMLDKKMSRTWNRASVILIGIIAAVSAFLPIGSTFAISRILQLLTIAVVAIINFIFILISFLIFLIASIFFGPGVDGFNEPIDMNETIPEQFMFDPIESPPSTPIFGGIFWMIVIVAVIAAVIFFLRGRGVPISGNKIMTSFANTWQRFRTWFWGIWHGMGRQVQQLERSIRERLQTTENPAVGLFSINRPSFRSLSPAEKIRYYYLSVVSRAESKGVERGKSETPSEYAADLIKEWPEANNEVETLTEAFEKARYSPKPMTSEDLGPIKETWNRIKSALRKRKS